MSKQEQLLVVDSLNKPIGCKNGDEVQCLSMSRELIHELGLIHRAVLVLLSKSVDGIVYYLLQKRAEDKDLYPGCLTFTASGHSLAELTELENAVRETLEEVGVNPQLRRHSVIKVFQPGDRQFLTIFFGNLLPDQKIEIDHEELASVEWHTREEIEALLKQEEEESVEIFTPASRAAFLRIFAEAEVVN